MAKSGVYEILNTTNGKRYVGSAVNLPRRKKEHWRRLRGNYHRNQYLQNAWNKYGEDAFEFDVIEYWEPEFLVSFEQWWMNMIQPEYNIAPVAGNSLGVTHTKKTRANMSAAAKGKTFSAEHRANLSAAGKGKKKSAEHIANQVAAMRGRKLTDEHRAKLSAAKKGKKLTDEHKAKLSAAAKAKPWTPAERAAYEANTINQ